MHLRSGSDAQILRRASTGPHALMLRQALAPYVPDRGTRFTGLPARSARRQYGGLGSPLTQGATGVISGASTGAAITGTTIGASIAGAAAAGSFVPIIGTAIGAIIGLVASGVFSHRTDPEVGNFNNAVALFNSNPQAIYNIADKYLVLAGLFDLETSQIKGNIPIVKKYGRLGEQKFTNDMVNVIQQAALAGQITGNDTPQSVMNNVVQPWINSFGYGSMSDTNGNMITAIIVGMIAEYVTGLYKTRWFARSGDFPFGNVAEFYLPGPATSAPAPSVTAGPTPSPILAPSTAQGTVPSELQGYLAGQVPITGAPITYARNASSQFVALPAGGTFEGIDSSTGGWIVGYSTGEYTITNQTLNPYSPASGNMGIQPIPALATVTSLNPNAVGQPSDAPGATAVSPVPQVVYSSGGGSYAPVPAVSSPLVSATATGSFSDMDLIAIGGGILLLVLFLKRKKT